MPGPPNTLPADFFSTKNAGAPDTLPADFFAPAQQAAAPNFGPANLAPSPLDNFGKGVSNQLEQLNPMTVLQGLADMTAHPIETAKALMQSQADVGGKAYEAFQKGDYAGGIRHGINYMIPVMGPQIDAIADKAEAGMVAEAMGEAATFGVINALPGSRAAKAVTRKLVAPILPAVETANAKVLSALDFAKRRNVATSAAMVTDNKAIKGAQQIIDYNPGGASIAARAKAGQDADLTRVLGELADETHPDAVGANQAATDVRTALETDVSTHKGNADTHYSKWRKLAADPDNLVKVQNGTKTEIINGKPQQVPTYEDIALPVDYKELADTFRPIYEHYKRTLPQAQKSAGVGYLALKNIVEYEKRYVPATVAETDLGMLKEAARSEMPLLASRSEGLAKHAVSHMDAAITKAARSAKTFDNSGAPAVAPKPAAAPAPAAATPAPVLAATGTDGAIPMPQRQPAQPRRATTETSVKVPGRKDAEYAARYEVRELDDVQTSHKGDTFQPNTKYKLKNDRNYHKGANQEKVVNWSTDEQFDPTYHLTDIENALDGPIVIDSTGNALGGNGRGMILQRLSEKGAAKYRTLLESKAGQFGIDPETFKGMKRPTLVRVVDDAEFTKPGKTKANAITDFNVKGTADLTPSERAVADSRRVSTGTLDDVAKRLDAAGSDATLASVIEGPAGLEVLQRLMDDGVIAMQERAAFQTGEGVNASLSKAGKERISSLMLGRYFRDADQMDTIPAAVRGKMERIAAPLASVEGNEVWNLSSHVQDAIELTERARTAGGTLEDFMRQGGLLIEQEYSPQSIAFAKQLRDVNPNELVKSVRAYADDMRYSDKYEGPGMFGDLPEPKHPAAAFKDAFGVELPKGATMEPIERAKPKFASFNEQDFPVKAEAPPRPMKSTGSEALDTIRKARSETRLEHETGKILKKLREEPGEAFKQFIYQKDSGVEYLKKVAKLAPEDMPKVGRAVLQDLIGTATGEGGFDRARGIAAKWDAIGPETKAIIFKNPQLRADLDSFFLLAKKAAEVPNPSGTAVVGSLSAAAGYAFHDPVTAAAWTISAAGMAKLLHSPAGVNALRNGLKVSLKRPVEASMAAARILKIAGDLAKPQQQERAKAKQ